MFLLVGLEFDFVVYVVGVVEEDEDVVCEEVVDGLVDGEGEVEVEEFDGFLDWF